MIEDAGRSAPSYNNGAAPYYCLSTYIDHTGRRGPLPDDITGDTIGARLPGTDGAWRVALGGSGRLRQRHLRPVRRRRRRPIAAANTAR